MVVSTSILSIQENIEQKLEQLNQTDTDYIHLDVMDGKFVKNQTRDYVPLKNHIKKPIDAIKNKIAFITEDRKVTGIYPMLSVANNMTIVSLNKFLSKLQLLNYFSFIYLTCNYSRWNIILTRKGIPSFLFV